MVKLKLTDGLIGNDAIGDINDRFFHILRSILVGGKAILLVPNLDMPDRELQ